MKTHKARLTKEKLGGRLAVTAILSWLMLLTLAPTASATVYASASVQVQCDPTYWPSAANYVTVGYSASAGGDDPLTDIGQWSATGYFTMNASDEGVSSQEADAGFWPLRMDATVGDSRSDWSIPDGTVLEAYAEAHAEATSGVAKAVAKGENVCGAGLGDGGGGIVLHFSCSTDSDDDGNCDLPPI